MHRGALSGEVPGGRRTRRVPVSPGALLAHDVAFAVGPFEIDTQLNACDEA